MKKSLSACLLITVAIVFAAGVAVAEESTWTGEVLDLECYEKQGAKGPAHADCAKKCVKSGQPMGLLTDDGTVVLLKAGEDPAPYEALKDLAGEQAHVSGSLAEKDGMKVVTVTGSKAAA